MDRKHKAFCVVAISINKAMKPDLIKIPNKALQWFMYIFWSNRSDTADDGSYFLRLKF